MLLLHGFGDTPQTFQYLASRIHSAGYRVHAPLYPGHGTSVGDFLSSNADEWIGAARDALSRMRCDCDSVSIVGLSMGAAIGAVLADESNDIASLVLIAPYLEVPLLVRLALRVRWLWDPFVGNIESRHPLSIQDEDERGKSLSYGVVNGRAMAQLARVVRKARAALPRIVTPTLVIQSRADPRVKPATASMALRKLGAAEKQLVWTESGGHVITVDFGREKVFAETLKWIAKWSGQPDP